MKRLCSLTLYSEHLNSPIPVTWSDSEEGCGGGKTSGSKAWAVSKVKVQLYSSGMTLRHSGSQLSHM